MNVEKTIKMRQWLALLVAVGALSMSASEAQAVLQVTNGDFETGATDAATDVPGWYDLNTASEATAWWTTVSVVIGLSPTANTGVILGDGYGETGGAMGTGGRWLYQSIGTKDTSGAYYVTLDYGQPTDGNTGRKVGIQVDIYQGTFSGAIDDVDISTNGLTLITSLTTPYTSLAGEGNYTNYFESLDLSTANTTDELWIRLANLPGTGTDGGAWAVIDNVAIVSDLPAFHPIGVSPTGTGVSNPVLLEAVVADWGTSLSDAMMKLDGSEVAVTITPYGSITNIVSYNAGDLAAGSTHTGLVVVTGTDASVASNQWTFTIQEPLTLLSTAPTGGGVTPDPTLEVQIASGDSDVDSSSVALFLNGSPVAIDSSSEANGIYTFGATVSPSLSSATAYAGMVVYAGINPAAGPYTNTWTFTTAGDPGFGIYITDTNAPAPDAYDVYQFAFATNDADNIAGGDDAASYVAHDRLAQGQTFTTGSESSYELSSIWVKHTQGYETWSEFNLGDDHLLRITDPSQAGTVAFLIYSELLTVVTNTAGSMQGMPMTGTGYWIEYRLQSPVTLNGSTQYGFDLSTDSNVYGEFYELAGVASNVYAGGSAYTSGTENGFGNDDMTTIWAGDHTFLVDLAPSGGGGPGVTPNIMSIVLSGGSAMLIWDSESGVTYSILSKTSLTAGSWTEVTNGISGAGASTTASVPAASAQEFFTVEGN